MNVDKKVVDLAKAIYTQKIAESAMEPTARGETNTTRAEWFSRYGVRAFEAAKSFFDVLASLEADVSEKVEAVEETPVTKPQPKTDAMQVGKKGKTA